MAGICLGSRPAYFEFLLKPAMLEEHLMQENPDPSPTDLIIQMVYSNMQKSAPDQSVGSLGDIQMMQRKTHMLIILPLRIFAHLNFDVQLMLDKLPLEVCDTLLKYLLGECLGPIAGDLTPASFSSITLSSLLPHQVMALSIFFRYVLASVVASRMPRVPPQRTTPLNIPGLSTEGNVEYREERDSLMVELNAKADFIAKRLENLIDAQSVSYPDSNSFSLTLSAPGAMQGSSHNFSNCTNIPIADFQCQIHYDIGLFYFVTDHYSEALHHLNQASTIYGNVQQPSVYCSVKESLLTAYVSSCNAVCGRNTPLVRRTLLDRFHNCASASTHHGLLEVLSEDDLKQQIPYYLRHKLQLDLMKEKTPPNTQGLFFNVLCHNVVRCVFERRSWDPNFAGHFTSAGKQGAIFLLQILTANLPNLSETQKSSVREFLMTLNLQEGVSGILVPNLLNSPVRNHFFPGDQMMEMWQGAEEENQAKLMRQALDTDYGAPGGDDVTWKLIQCYEPVSLRRSVTLYTQNMPAKDILDLNVKWELPTPIGSAASKLPSLLHRNLITISVAKALELAVTKRWSSALELAASAMKVCREMPEAEATRLYKMLSWVKLTISIQQWVDELPNRSEGDEEVIAEAKICLRSFNGREKVLPWPEVVNCCIICLVNTRDFGAVHSIISSLSPHSSHLPLLSLLQPLQAVAHLVDSPTHQPEAPFLPHLWDSVSSILDVNKSYKGHKTNDSLSLKAFLTFLKNLKETTCLSLLSSLLGVMYNKLLGEPSAEIHTQHASLWAPMTPNKDLDLNVVREVLSIIVKHAIQFYPGADHVNETTSTSWHMTSADLYYTSDEYQEALCGYLSAIFVATNNLRSEPSDEGTAHLVGDRAVRRMVRCCMSLGCFTQAGLLCQFLEPIDYSTAIRCLQDRSGVDAMDAYYNCLWDVTLMEFIINMHQKRGELQRRDEVLKVIGQLELNSNNNEEIQREAAKVRKHRLLRALAKQYLH